MKKLLILSLLFLIFSAASAQVAVGIKAGGNYSNLRSSAIPKIGKPYFKPGFHAGLFMVFINGKVVSVRQELLLNVKGWKYADSVKTENQHLSYLNQSLLFYLKPAPKLSILFGPEVGYLIRSRPTNEGPFDTKTDFPEIRDFNRLEAGIIGGISYQVLEQLSLEARYVRGISHVLDWQIPTPPYIFKGGKNQVFQISVNYMLSKAVKEVNKP